MKNQNLPKGWRKACPPQNWRRVKLGEVASIKSGEFMPTHERKEKGSYPIYGSNGIIGFAEKYLFEEPVITVGRVGAYGQVYITKSKSWVTDNVLVIKDKEASDFHFLYYYLKIFNFNSIVTGSTQPLITQSALAESEIILPPLTEQKRISSILSAFDDKIELNNKINQTLEKMAQAIFKEWFICGKKLKVKSNKVKLCEVVKTQYGYTESASDKSIGPKFLRVTDINKTNWIDWSTVPYCRIGDKEFSKYKLRKGDIVIARMADPGKVGIIEENIDAVFGSYLIRLQITSNSVTPYFLFYYLCSPLYQNFIFGASTGTTRRSINAWVMTNVELILPAREKILRFDKVASIIREKIKSNVKENQKLTALRDLLLPKLMSGEIKVNSE